MKLTDINNLGEKFSGSVRENIAHIILGSVLLLMVFVSFTDLSAGTGSLDWFNLFINIVLQLTVFLPYRWRQKRISGLAEPFKANKNIYGQKVGRLHADNDLSNFSKFCDHMTQEMRRQKQLDIVHNAGIDTVTYDSKTTEGLDDKQIKAIKKANAIKVHSINPTCITSDSSKVKGYGIEYNETREDAVSVAGKMVTIIVMAVIPTLIVITSLGYSGLGVFVMIFFRIVMCLTAMLSAIMSGDGAVIKKDKVILCRIDFIDLFYEWKGKEQGIVFKRLFD